MKMQEDPHKSALENRFRVSNMAIILAFAILVALSVRFVFDERATLVDSQIDQRISSLSHSISETLRLSVENLQAVSSIVITFDNVSYSQFKRVTNNYFDVDSGLMILEWQPVVPAAQREEFVRRARSSGLRNFRIWEPGVSGDPIRAKTREEHVPVYFMVSRPPAQSDVDTLGLDLAWSPERMESKWAARDMGRARASGLFYVVTGPNSDYKPLGFAITLPVYRDGFIPGNVADRKLQLLGYMAGVYSIRDLFKTHIDQLKEEGFNIEIHDSSDVQRRLYIKSGSPSDYQSEINLGLLGNSLHIRLIATESYVSEQFKLIWALLPSALIVLGIFIIGFLRQLEIKNLTLASSKVELEKLNSELVTLSQIDSLTGLLNRRAFINTLEHQLELIRRYPECIALLMIDLDHFKSVNDRWGHPAGDQVLVAFAEECQKLSRKIDTIARIGGEEFAMMLINTDRDEAINFAERLREHISRMRIPVSDSESEISITVSIGLSVIDKPISRQRWIEQTDKALYLAKNSGRNCMKEYRQED